MKGNAELPMCGFSARAVNILKSCGAKFTTVDVLQDEEIRQGIKIYSNCQPSRNYMLAVNLLVAAISC